MFNSRPDAMHIKTLQKKWGGESNKQIRPFFVLGSWQVDNISSQSIYTHFLFPADIIDTDY